MSLQGLSEDNKKTGQQFLLYLVPAIVLSAVIIMYSSKEASYVEVEKGSSIEDTQATITGEPTSTVTATTSSTTTSSTTTMETTIIKPIQEEPLELELITHQGELEHYPICKETKSIVFSLKNEGSAEDIELSAELPSGTKLTVEPETASLKGNETKKFLLSIKDTQFDDSQNITLKIVSRNMTITNKMPIKNMYAKCVSYTPHGVGGG